MGKKKKGPSKKATAKRVSAPAPKKKAAKVLSAALEPEKPKMPERIKEKNAGVGVLKTVGGVILALIVGSMVLFNVSGGRKSARGDKILGEQCDKTAECASGTICYSYKGSKKRCMKRCSESKPCGPGFSCISATQQKRRKGVRIDDICVEDSKL